MQLLREVKKEELSRESIGIINYQKVNSDDLLGIISHCIMALLQILLNWRQREHVEITWT